MLVDSWSVVEVVDEDGLTKTVFPAVKCGLVEFNGRYRTRTQRQRQLTRRVLGPHLFLDNFLIWPPWKDCLDKC